MADPKPKFPTTVTEAQWDAINALCDKTRIPRSELVRTGLARLCAEHGIDWPDDMPKPGAQPDTPA